MQRAGQLTFVGKKKWHQIALSKYDQDYGQGIKWEPSGIVQCFLDLDSSTNTMSFGYNGTSLGIAYENFIVRSGLYPAFSTTDENECSINLGYIPFKFSHIGFEPLAHANKPNSTQDKSPHKKNK